MIAIILEASVRALVITAGIGLVLFLARVRAGAWRHAAWTTALVAMVASPIVTLWRPALPVEVPHVIAFDQELASETSDARSLPAALESPATLTAGHPDTTAAATAPAAASAAWLLPLSWAAIVAGLWLLGFLVTAARMVVGWRMARRLRLSATDVSTEIGHGSMPPILESPLVAAPIVVGVLRPTIILPHIWRTWPREHLDAALAHEQAHIRRRDQLVSFVSRMNRAIYWFHPAAWVLDRAIARAAEEACDDEVVRAQGQDAGYASVLVETARAIHAHGRRVSWNALGIGGGRLESRIDRVLSGEAWRLVSRVKLAVLAVSCLGIVVAGAACQQQPAPLKPNADYTAMRQNQAEHFGRLNAAAAMDREQVAALEAQLARTPDDIAASEAILHFYRQSGQKVFGWNEMIERRRPHLLRVVARHPESELARQRIVKEHDPRGYQEVRALWMAHTSKADATPATLGNAADFFSLYEKPEAETLLLRAIALDPGGPQPRTDWSQGLYFQAWSSRLGELYARGILGFVGDDGYGGRRRVDPLEATGPFANRARAALETSIDVDVLVSAAQILSGGGRQGDAPAATALKRAAQLAPESPQLRGLLARREHNRERTRLRPIVSKALQSGDTRLETLSDPDRFKAFADGFDWWTVRRLSPAPATGTNADRPRTVEIRPAPDVSRRLAEAALAHAEKFRENPDYGTVLFNARLRLCEAAIDEGDIQEAVAHLRAAGQAPPSSALQYLQPVSTLRPMNALLQAGERESLAEFLERLAEVNVIGRDLYLIEAKAVRSGQMTRSYQAVFGPR